MVNHHQPIPREVGRRKEDLSDESTAKILKVAKQLIRTDFGGSPDPIGVLRKKFASAGIDAGDKSLKFVKELLEETVDSCRKRAFPRIDEAIRRLEKQETTVEKLP